MTRSEAVLKLHQPVYNQKMYASDRKFVLDKLGISDSEFDRIMLLPQNPHELFGSDQYLYNWETTIRQSLKKAKHIAKVILD